MTPHDLESIKNVVKMAIEEHHNEFWVDAEKHYNHHKLVEICSEKRPEWEENHKFISNVRAGNDVCKKAGIGAMMVAVIAFMVFAIRIVLSHLGLKVAP